MSILTVEFTCANCGDKLTAKNMELDAACLVVCRDCYLANVPPCDIDGAAHDVAVDSSTIPDADWTEDAYDRLIQAMMAEDDAE